MRRPCLSLVLAVAISATAGCSIVSHGDDLPSAADRADAEYSNPRSDFKRPLDASRPNR